MRGPKFTGGGRDIAQKVRGGVPVSEGGPLGDKGRVAGDVSSEGGGQSRLRGEDRRDEHHSKRTSVDRGGIPRRGKPA